MKSATEGQFRELIGKLLTRVDCKKIDFNQIQKFIKDPHSAELLFINLINVSMQLGLEDLVIGNRMKGKVYEPTTVQKGDTLIFFYQDKTIKVWRHSLDHEPGMEVLFNRGKVSLDDKDMTNLVRLEEILQHCSFYATIIGCRAEWWNKEMMEKGLIYVKFV